MKSTLIIFLLLICITANSQQIRRFQIIDSITKERISFATINVRSQLFFEADSSGEFRYAPQKNDTILITCVGYFDKQITDLSTCPSEIKLVHKPVELNNVYVGKFKTMQVGIINAKKDFSMTANLGYRSEYATLVTIPDEVNKYSVQRIYFKVYTKSAITGNMNPVRIHVYGVNNDGSPGDDLLENDIVLTSIILKGKYLVVDIPEPNKIQKQRSFFISMQWLNVQKDTIDYKQPQIAFEKSQNSKSTWMRQLNFNKYNWIQFKNMGNMIVYADIQVYE